jgi:HSP20 family molecular chaperone IbpA
LGAHLGSVKRKREVAVPDQPSPQLDGFARALSESFQIIYTGLQRAQEGAQAAARVARTPKVSVSEDSDGSARVTASMPGVGSDDIQVKIKGDQLHLWGTTRDPKNPGDFDESVPLPAGVDATKATVSLQNGIFTMDLPAADASVTPTGKTT